MYYNQMGSQAVVMAQKLLHSQLVVALMCSLGTAAKGKHSLFPAQGHAITVKFIHSIGIHSIIHSTSTVPPFTALRVVHK